MRRRDFIKKTSKATSFFVLPSNSLMSFSGLETKKITILHTNDTHSHIDPFIGNDATKGLQGGVSRRAALIAEIRNKNPNVLLLDAGDIFQGTPYFNYFGGELEFKLMSMMKYDAATLGNHDFDNGLEGFYKQLPHAKFDFVSANYDFKNTILDSHIKPYKIFNKSNIKIGVFGLGIELQGLVNKKNYKETTYLNPIEISQDMTSILKKEHQCDLIICLSHLGYEYKNNDIDKISDLKLAEQTQDIDLIIGGHTHTFLEKPTVVKNKIGNNVLINQVGCYGINLGQIDFYFDKKNKNNTQAKNIII